MNPGLWRIAGLALFEEASIVLLVGGVGPRAVLGGEGIGAPSDDEWLCWLVPEMNTEEAEHRVSP